jgi:hypothetical protein
MVSALVLTAVPLEALDLPPEAISLIAWLVAESSATIVSLAAVLVVLGPLMYVPAGALVCDVPLALPPEVLT